MNIGDLFLRLLVDSSDFERQVVAQGEAAGAKAGTAMGSTLAANMAASAKSIGATLGGIGQSLTRTGRSLTTGLTLPIVAAGAAVTHFALDFDTTLRRVIGLTDVTEAEIDGIRDSILALAPAVGIGPQELAEAFYFVASAGFKADEAMDVLETSAKAAAAGLGETQTIAQVLGSVINAYGKENITAARAADILVEAVSQGTAEADAFAGVIGRVVPAAAAMGVTFDQVAAALAAMTLGGLSAEEASVGLNQVLVSLLKPTTQAVDALTSLGLSSEGLRKQLREEGLLATLRTLEERFGANEAAAAAVFGNIRALRTVTNLLNLDSEQLNDVFGKVENSLGRLEVAYDETEGPQRDLDRATADLQASLTELGEDVLPNVVTGIQGVAGAARELTKWWRTLDQPTRQFIVNALAVGAVIGPLLIIVGSLTKAVGALFTAFAALLGPKGLVALPARLSAAAKVAGRVAPWAALLAVLLEIPDAILGIERAIDGFVTNSPRKVLNGIRLINHILEANPFTAGMAEANELVLDEIERQFEDTAEHVDGLFGGWGERSGPIVGPIEEATDLIAVVLEDGSIEVRDGAEAMVDPIEQAMIDARAKMGEQARGLINDLASILDTAPDELEDELTAFFEALGQPFTEAERLAQLAGQGARTEWAAAFASGDPQAEAAAFNEFSTRVLDQLELLQPDIFGAGQAVPTGYMEGIEANVSAAVASLQANGRLGEFADAFDLADQLDAMGETALGAFVRGMEIERVTRELESGEIADLTEAFNVADQLEALGDTAGAEHIRGMAEGLERARASTLRTQLQRTANDIRQQMSVSLWPQGNRAGTTFGDGLRAAQGYINDKAQQLREGVTRILEFAGSPPYTHSRLIGANVGKSWGTGIAAAIASILPELAKSITSVTDVMSSTPTLAGLAGGMASYPMAGLTSIPAGPVAGPPAAGAHTTNNTWQLVLNGVQYTFKSRDDFIAALDDLAVFGGADGRQDG